MRDGGFNLRKWISNSQKLMQWIDQEEGVPITESGKLAEEDQTYATTYLGIKGNAAEERKVLGLNWDIIRDTFIIRFDWLVRFAKELPSTKRSILRVVAKLYDPLGFMSPLFTAVKILFQDLCKSKTDWDEPICDELNFKYTKWLFDLMKGISTQLVMSKTRVAPLKRSTIPRLELLAALILARLVVRVKEALQPVAQVNELFCWTDSMTTLHWIKGIDKEYKSNVQKVYLALFTCGSTRAVHLEIVPDLSSETFIRSFKRFVCRRGIPRLVVSDNAKTFKTAARVLSTVFDLPDVQRYLLNLKVKWRFNLERAPWWGGFFERLIRCVKRCLKKILKNAKLSYEELLTVVTEVECVLNSRPLTYMSSDGLEEPLTPSHLMTGRRLLSIPDEIVVAEEETSEVSLLTRRRRYLLLLLSHFWRRWKREYVVELREHHRAKKGTSNGRSIKRGDIVTVMEEGKSNRGTWKLGKVQEVHPGNDGFARGATVEVISNKGKRIRIKRPLQKLYPLEVTTTEVPDTSSPTYKRPEQRLRRKAAVAGEMKRRQVDQCS